MQVTGMLYGAKLLQFVGFPTSEVLGPSAGEEEIRGLIDRYGTIFVKPVFKGGVGKKGKAGLIGRAQDLKTALKEKEREKASLDPAMSTEDVIRDREELRDRTDQVLLVAQHVRRNLRRGRLEKSRAFTSAKSFFYRSSSSTSQLPRRCAPPTRVKT